MIIQFFLTPLNNGNIAETTWRTASDNVRRRYGYSYDYLNRLRDAYYQIPGTTMPLAQCYDEYLTYDKNGNIMSLFRNGEVDDPNNVQEIDDLTYEYDDGNKLLKVTDATTHSAGFKDGNTANNPDFEYDGYGNMIKDRNKEIEEIVYNHLNLPKKIIFENNNTIEYLYDANGTKLKKKVTEGSTITNTHYIDGYQYKEDKLDFFPTTEGYVKATQTSGGGIGGGGVSYNYVFNYTDHLGNIRLRYAINPINQWLEIVEEDHYYPFGFKHNGYNAQNYVFGSIGEGPVELIPTNPGLLETYKYKFNGMEYQSEMGLDFYDFGARNYDPTLGRWMNIDPLAELMRRHSPYNYAFNNPIFFIDPDGMMGIGFVSQASFGTSDSFIDMSSGDLVGDKGGSRDGPDTDYKINKGTGKISQVGKPNNEPDRILKTDKDGNIKKKGDGFLGFLIKKSERGKAKVAIDGISKGILEDGLNLKEDNGSFNVNGDGQPTLEEFNKFISEFSDFVGKEIAGVRLGEENSNNVSRVLTNKYANSTRTQSQTPKMWFRQFGSHLKGHFHTHPYNDPTPSKAYDMKLKGMYPGLPFFIIAGGNERKY